MAFEPVPSDSQSQAALALHRFGFGPKPGDIARIAADPRGALIAELKAGPKAIDDPTLSSSAEDARHTAAFQQERKREREARRMQPASGGGAISRDMAGAESNEMSVRKPSPPLPQRIYLQEAEAHYQAALDTNIGLVERLVWFWSNHFCVSADKGLVRSLCGAYEREAIRPQCALVRTGLDRRPAPA